MARPGLSLCPPVYRPKQDTNVPKAEIPQLRRQKTSLADEFVVHDGSGQSAVRGFGDWSVFPLLFISIFRRVRSRSGIIGCLVADDPALAQDVAVLLSGDLFRHLKYHFDQRIHRQGLWSPKQQTRLAEVVDRPLIPGTGAVHPVTQPQIELETPRPRRPRRPFLSRVGAPYAGFRLGMFHPFNPAHGRPVILVLGGAQKTNLVIVSVRATPRPGKLV